MKQYYNQRHELACDIDSELPPEPLFEDVRPQHKAGHPPPHRKRQLWFLRLLARRTPVTRLLSALTTRKVTAVLMYDKETLPDRNRTRKIDGA